MLTESEGGRRVKRKRMEVFVDVTRTCCVLGGMEWKVD